MASSRRPDTEPRYMHASSRVSNSGISAEVYHNNWVCVNLSNFTQLVLVWFDKWLDLTMWWTPVGYLAMFLFLCILLCAPVFDMNQISSHLSASSNIDCFIFYSLFLYFHASLTCQVFRLCRLEHHLLVPLRRIILSARERLRYPVIQPLLMELNHTHRIPTHELNKLHISEHWNVSDRLCSSMMR